MNETLTKILEQDKSQKWFFIVTGTIFGALAAYLFLFNKQIPDQLQTMWLTVCGFIAAGWSKGINKVEQMLNKDLDGDGDIGADNAVTTATPAAAIQASPAITEAVQDGPVAQETVAAVENGRSNNSPG